MNDPICSTEAITRWLQKRRGEWFDVKTIRNGVAEDYNVGPLNPGISEGAVRYNLAQLLRTGPSVFEQRRLKKREGKKRSMYEFRMKPGKQQPPSPPVQTSWTLFVDMF